MQNGDDIDCSRLEIAMTRPLSKIYQKKIIEINEMKVNNINYRFTYKLKKVTTFEKAKERERQGGRDKRMKMIISKLRIQSY